MNQTESPTKDQSVHIQQHLKNDVQICSQYIALMKSTAERCRGWREESTSPLCKGGLATSAFVCDSLASSMEACMDLMGANKKALKETTVKKDCCS
jgi:hypothetical protein